MKNKFQNIVILTFMIANNMLFAQGPDPDGAGGGANPTDAPINHQLIWLALVSLLFAYYIITKKLKKSSSSF